MGLLVHVCDGQRVLSDSESCCAADGCRRRPFETQVAAGVVGGSACSQKSERGLGTQSPGWFELRVGRVWVLGAGYGFGSSRECKPQGASSNTTRLPNIYKTDQTAAVGFDCHSSCVFQASGADPLLDSSQVSKKHQSSANSQTVTTIRKLDKKSKAQPDVTNY